jgi:hypothetical protein
MRLAGRGAERVVGDMVGKVMHPVADGLKLAGLGLVTAVFAVVGVIFFSLALFVWAEQSYGRLNACLLMGAVYFLVAGAILGGGLLLRRQSSKPRKPPPAPPPDPESLAAGQQWWKDPAVVAAGLELVRIVGLRRIIPAVALGAAIFGAMESSSNRRRKGEGA